MNKQRGLLSKYMLLRFVKENARKTIRETFITGSHTLVKRTLFFNLHALKNTEAKFKTETLHGWNEKPKKAGCKESRKDYRSEADTLSGCLSFIYPSLFSSKEHIQALETIDNRFLTTYLSFFYRTVSSFINCFPLNFPSRISIDDYLNFTSCLQLKKIDDELKGARKVFCGFGAARCFLLNFKLMLEVVE